MEREREGRVVIYDVALMYFTDFACFFFNTTFYKFNFNYKIARNFSFEKNWVSDNFTDHRKDSMGLWWERTQYFECGWDCFPKQSLNVRKIVLQGKTPTKEQKCHNMQQKYINSTTLKSVTIPLFSQLWILPKKQRAQFYNFWKKRQKETTFSSGNKSVREIYPKHILLSKKWWVQIIL